VTTYAADEAGSADSVTARTILQGTVDIARTVFAAHSASVLLLDAAADQLVFEAVAHPDEQHLVGLAFPASSGIAGWVLQSGQTMLVDDVGSDPNFARQTARATGYVPERLMAAPIGGLDDDWIGVLEVLDRSDGYRGEMTDVALLALLAHQAAASLQLIVEARQAEAALRMARGGGPAGAADSGRALAALDAIVRHVAGDDPAAPPSDDSLQLLESLSRVLSGPSREGRNT
jgi:GAF domain-containing protein